MQRDAKTGLRSWTLTWLGCPHWPVLSLLLLTKALTQMFLKNVCCWGLFACSPAVWKNNSTHFSPLNLDLCSNPRESHYPLVLHHPPKKSFYRRFFLPQTLPCPASTWPSMVRELLPLEVLLNTSLDSKCKKYR